MEPVYLRSLESSDLDLCYQWHSDKSLYETLWGPFHYVSRQSVASWLDRKIAYSNEEMNFAMCARETGKHIGNIYLRSINWICRHAELSIFIGEQAERGKGFGQSAVRQLVFYAFNDLGLNKVYLDVLADNHPAIHIYEKCGFRVEGTLKNHAFKNGAWKDVVVMGVCKEYL